MTCFFSPPRLAALWAAWGRLRGLFRFGAGMRQGVTALALLCAAAAGQAHSACPDEPIRLRPLLPGLAVHDGLWPSVQANGTSHWASTVVLWHAGQATVIDPGPTRCSAQPLHAAIQRLGAVQVQRLVNTHAHAEQVLGNVRWRVPVAATATTQASMQRRCPDCLAALRRDLGAKALRGTRIALPTEVLREGDVLMAGGRRWQVLEMPMAHTESDLVLWSAQDQVLLAGGLIDGHRLVLAQGRISGWLQALQRMADLPVQWLVGQHRSAAGAQQVAQAIDAQKQALCTLVRQSWQGLEQGLTESETLARLPFEAEPEAQRQQRFNLSRAWREMEALWIAHEPMPLACADQAQTSGGS